MCKHSHCVVIANPTSSNKAHESSPKEACEASRALHIVRSITKLEAAKAVSSSTLLRAKMDSVRQAISDGEVSEGVAEKANNLF